MGMKRWMNGVLDELSAVVPLQAIWRSRTLWLGHLVALLGLLEVNLHFFAAYLPAWATGVSYIIIGFAIYLARAITTKPLAERAGPTFARSGGLAGRAPGA